MGMVILIVKWESWLDWYDCMLYTHAVKPINIINTELLFAQAKLHQFYENIMHFLVFLLFTYCLIW